MSGMRDPRPHIGEPLALDLLNTQWMSSDGPQDLLSDLDGAQCWLATNGLADRCDADEKVRNALVAAREAILGVVEHRSIDDFNALLDRGRIRRTLTESGPQEMADVPSEWLAGWLAADSLLSLLGEAPDRIKQCAHPHCILWFHDTSKNGARRWHSMAVCGNRAKAARHYAAKRD
jgi:predicted RNA-binding Zn ribbon-like protein